MVNTIFKLPFLLAPSAGSWTSLFLINKAKKKRDPSIPVFSLAPQAEVRKEHWGAVAEGGRKGGRREWMVISKTLGPMPE